ncbi:hypothetical protein RHMOL_Rhmol10G0189700 [Rhododendron molle]|uniref:Uncharacterized protein n=1 Tax=Rhododendron molle TaxID=49168 RepID=A0ACC0M440_RHOML|nr:hypothetical protein RHMOL_Rhmol10G0189700 [Rhododendron molle]
MTSLPLNKEASPGLRTVAFGINDRKPGMLCCVGMPMHHGVTFSNSDELTSQHGGIPRREHQCVILEDFRIVRAYLSSRRHPPKGTPMRRRGRFSNSDELTSQ